MMRRVTSAYLGAALLIMATASVQATSAAGKKIFQAKKCQACHYTKGPAREKTIADQLAKKGPELWYAGSKFQKAWLKKWLQNPKPIRPMKYNSLALVKSRGSVAKSFVTLGPSPLPVSPWHWAQ